MSEPTDYCKCPAVLNLQPNGIIYCKVVLGWVIHECGKPISDETQKLIASRVTSAWRPEQLN